MKILIVMLLIAAFMGLIVVPSYLMLNFFNVRMTPYYQLPKTRVIVISLVMAALINVLLGVDFEGAALSWFVAALFSYGVCLISAVAGYIFFRYFKNRI